MTSAELHEAVTIQLEAMTIIVNELLALQAEVMGREPTLREKTAAAAFLAQFYNGLENILKRISVYYSVPLPVGETWHVELFRRFCAPSYPLLPALFDATLAAALAPYRRFRHVVFHGYSFQLEWPRMVEGIGQVGGLFVAITDTLVGYLQTLDVASP